MVAHQEVAKVATLYFQRSLRLVEVVVEPVLVLAVKVVLVVVVVPKVVLELLETKVDIHLLKVLMVPTLVATISLVVVVVRVPLQVAVKVEQGQRHQLLVLQ
jgi:hypothetical protein